MKLSKLNELPTTREMIDVFGGYNHNLRIREGEFYDMTNLTSADYPVLSPRPKREIYAYPTSQTSQPSGMVSKDSLCYVEDGYFIFNKYRIDMRNYLSNDATMLPKTLISMGSYVIIMPDKAYINTTKNEEDDAFEMGKIEATFESSNYSSTQTSFQLCDIKGETYVNKTDFNMPPISTNPPDLSRYNEDERNGYLWIDSSATPHVLKRYALTLGEWVSVSQTYIRISFNKNLVDLDLSTIFSVGDGLSFPGITADYYRLDYEEFNEEETPIGKQIQEQLGGKPLVATAVGDRYIVVPGMIDGGANQNAEKRPFTIKRQMPIMDYIIESGNRLWGCHYGVANNGEVVNEIYASKLGDFKNWNSFAGISTDSYVASVGTDGQFTGATNYLGYPLFFKENCLHKVYGNYPSNYQIQTTECRGVQKGCSKSLAIVNETLYYKSRSAVCAYDGSLPVEVSSAFGDISYEDAVAGSLGNKYYISMKHTASETDYSLFVYDTQKGMWHREDNTHAREFCNSRGNLYYIDHDTRQIMSVQPVINGSLDKDTTPLKWNAITGIIGTDIPDKKYISRLVVRLSLEVGTKVYFYVEYDSCGAWEHLFSMTGTNLKTFSIPVRPKRCDHLRLRIDGEGEAKIFSICKTIEQGSDV